MGVEEAAGEPGLGGLREKGGVQGSAREVLPLPVAPPVEVSWGPLEVRAMAGGASEEGRARWAPGGRVHGRHFQGLLDLLRGGLPGGSMGYSPASR